MRFYLDLDHPGQMVQGNDYARIARALAVYAEHYGDGSTDFLFDFLR